MIKFDDYYKMIALNSMIIINLVQGFDDFYKMIALNSMILINLVQGFDDFNKFGSRIR